jgi:hypothetical protein
MAHTYNSATPWSRRRIRRSSASSRSAMGSNWSSAPSWTANVTGNCKRPRSRPCSAS